MGAAAEKDVQSPAVWRCGNSYSSTPCEAGQSGKPVDPADPRSEVDRRAADVSTRRAQTEADRLQRDRTALEDKTAAADRAAGKSQAKALSAERKQAAMEKAAAAKPDRKKKHGKLPPDYFTASGNATATGAAAEKPQKKKKKKE